MEPWADDEGAADGAVGSAGGAAEDCGDVLASWADGAVCGDAAVSERGGGVLVCGGGEGVLAGVGKRGEVRRMKDEG